MKNLLRGVLWGMLVGLIAGWFLADQQQKRELKAASEAYANDPEVIAIRKEREREKRVETWLGEIDQLEDE